MVTFRGITDLAGMPVLEYEMPDGTLHRSTMDDARALGLPIPEPGRMRDYANDIGPAPQRQGMLAQALPEEMGTEDIMGPVHQALGGMAPKTMTDAEQADYDLKRRQLNPSVKVVGNTPQPGMENYQPPQRRPMSPGAGPRRQEMDVEMKSTSGSESTSGRSVKTIGTPEQRQEVSSLIDEAAALNLQAAVANAERTKKRAQSEALATHIRMSKLQQEQEVERGRLQQREKEKEQRFAAIDGRAREIAEMKVDHNRLFGDGNMQNKILGAIAIGLGQFSAAMNGGPNMAAQIINDKIKADVENQYDAIRSAKEGLSQQENELARWLQDHGPQVSKNILEVLGLQYAEAQARRTAALYEGTEAGMQLMQTTAAITDILAGKKQEMLTALGDEVNQKYEARQESGSEQKIGTPQRGKTEWDNPNKLLHQLQQDLRAEGIHNYAPAFALFDQALADAKDKNGDIEGYGLFGRLFDPAQGGVKSWMASLGQTEEGKKLKGAVAQIMDVLARDRSGAARSESEEKLYNFLVEGNMNAFAGPQDMLNAIDQVRTIFLSKDRAVRSGFPPEIGELYNEYQRGQTQTEFGDVTYYE